MKKKSSDRGSSNATKSKRINHIQPPLTDVQAADYLGVATQTMRNWRHLKRGPAYLKLSPGPRGRIAYLLEDLEAYRTRCRIDPEVRA